LNAILDMENNAPSQDLENEEITKEKDLDNDGVPDRIDINDNDNSIQKVTDLDIRYKKVNENKEKYTNAEIKENKKTEKAL
ncbi:hypothetical protein J2Z35_002910, partial [Acetoanaerobium pronyense]